MSVAANDVYRYEGIPGLTVLECRIESGHKRLRSLTPGRLAHSCQLGPIVSGSCTRSRVL